MNLLNYELKINNNLYEIFLIIDEKSIKGLDLFKLFI